MKKAKEAVYFSVDIECDGPAAGEYSMIEIGAVIVEDGMTRTFFANLAPISDKFNEHALSICKKTREETLAYEDPASVIKRFAEWVEENAKDKKAIFVNDNGFDWSFVNYYCWKFLDKNPFGHHDFNLSGFVKGIYQDPEMSVKKLHTRELLHNALEDAKDNADVLLRLKKNGWKPL